MRICVLQPSYERSLVDYRNYDLPRDLSPLMPEAEFVHAFLDKATVYRQLRALRRQGFDVFVNLCEGYLDWDIPSIDVIHSLGALDLPYTGPTPQLYDPSKELMKLVAWYAGVPTPEFVVARSADSIARAATALRFPLFVKPNLGGDSLGVDHGSFCRTPAELERKAWALIGEFDSVVIDEYVDGRELSVLVAADPACPTAPLAFRPVEFLFPEGESFKTYDLKTKQYQPDRNVPCADPALARQLKEMARRIFTAFRGVGYCRVDFRVDRRGVPHFLDVNFACSVFYPEGHYGTADYILQHDGFGAARFLRHIVAEGIARHQAGRKCYAVARSGVSGYCIRATRAIHQGETVFRGEERAQRCVTRRHALSTWAPEDIVMFRRYAYPLSEQVFLLWEDNPAGWAPQNHSCAPNTGCAGLDVVALRDIAPGEELTIDYETLYSEDMEPFACRCGSPACRGVIRGRPGNSVDRREPEASS